MKRELDVRDAILSVPKGQLWRLLGSSEDPEVWTKEWTSVRELQTSMSRQLEGVCVKKAPRSRRQEIIEPEKGEKGVEK